MLSPRRRACCFSCYVAATPAFTPLPDDASADARLRFVPRDVCHMSCFCYAAADAFQLISLRAGVITQRYAAALAADYAALWRALRCCRETE